MKPTGGDDKQQRSQMMAKWAIGRRELPIQSRDDEDVDGDDASRVFFFDDALASDKMNPSVHVRIYLLCLFVCLLPPPFEPNQPTNQPANQPATLHPHQFWKTKTSTTRL